MAIPPERRDIRHFNDDERWIRRFRIFPARRDGLVAVQSQVFGGDRTVNEGDVTAIGGIDGMSDGISLESASG